MDRAKICIVGGGPAGLMAAEKLAQAGHDITILERKPSPGRKFLMAGRGGLNLTHSEPLDKFLTRYGSAENFITQAINDFSPSDLRVWCEGLGQPTFVGSSGRVFPDSFKASPLLRAWIARLENLSVKIILQCEWTGLDKDGLTFKNADGSPNQIQPDATLLALGGASWPKLGSDGGWADILQQYNIPLAPFQPANCGFVIPWSSVFRNKFAGQPVKTIILTHYTHAIPGEIMIARNGIEGGAVYALSSSIRNAVNMSGETTVRIDLRPGLPRNAIEEKLQAPRRAQSFSTWLQKTLNLPPVAIGLLRESNMQAPDLPAHELAALIKELPLRITSPFPLDRAISTAGGIRLDAIDSNYMLKALPGVFVAGEMLDWEAPTGGYLLQATMATANAAAKGILRWLETAYCENRNP